MKHTTTLFILLFIMTSFANSFGQVKLVKIKDVDAVKNRPLIVVIEVPDQKVIDKLNKKNKSEYIDTYKKAIDDYNTKMKDAVDKYWTFSSNVEYKTAEDVENLIRKGSKDYTILRCVTMKSHGGGFEVYEGLNWTYTDFKDGEKDDNDFWKSITLLEVVLIEKSGGGRFSFTPLYYLGLQDIFPLESDLIFGIRGMQWYFSEREKKANLVDLWDMVKENSLLLKDKTLVARKELIDPKLTMEIIKTLYPYNFETDANDEFDQHLINSDEGYAVLEVSPALNVDYSFSSPAVTKVLSYTYYVLDAKTGDILGFVPPPATGSFFGSAVGSKTANERIFKKLGEDAAGK